MQYIFAGEGLHPEKCILSMQVLLLISTGPPVLLKLKFCLEYLIKKPVGLHITALRQN